MARITLDLETKQIKGLSILQSLRFKCRRCATFCCRLGGPKLNEQDVKRLKDTGYHEKDFLEPRLEGEFADLSTARGRMKSKEDGSCVFLRFDVSENCYVCLIYDFRPTLCKMYPFNYDRTSLNSIVLKVIPCCRGLKDPKGELVDEEFVNNRLLDSLLEAIRFS